MALIYEGFMIQGPSFSYVSKIELFSLATCSLTLELSMLKDHRGSANCGATGMTRFSPSHTRVLLDDGVAEVQEASVADWLQLQSAVYCTKWRA